MDNVNKMKQRNKNYRTKHYTERYMYDLSVKKVKICKHLFSLEKLEIMQTF